MKGKTKQKALENLTELNTTIWAIFDFNSDTFRSEMRWFCNCIKKFDENLIKVIYLRIR